jgi:hypothetical protein
VNGPLTSRVGNVRCLKVVFLFGDMAFREWMESVGWNIAGTGLHDVLESILGSLFSSSISGDKLCISKSQSQSSPILNTSESLPVTQGLKRRLMHVILISVHRLSAVSKLQISTRHHHEANKRNLPVM